VIKHWISAIAGIDWNIIKPTPIKSISVDYHILQPSQYSEGTSSSMGLTPYREWIQVDDPSVVLHGPFNFATLNNRKTRDRVAEQDWLVLKERQALYHNQAPTITQRIMHVDISQPTYENVTGNQEVQSRCERTFMLNLEFMIQHSKTSAPRPLECQKDILHPQIFLLQNMDPIISEVVVTTTYECRIGSTFEIYHIDQLRRCDHIMVIFTQGFIPCSLSGLSVLPTYQPT
jgi:hypothetical protein